MSVTRYDVNGPSSVFEDVNGSLVDFKDYAALEDKRAALAAELKQSKIDADCYKKGMEASNARLVQLAAENAKLADCANFYRLGFKPAKGAFGIEYRPTEQLLDDCGNTALEAIKTPATDAFLAEVRAQGVERLANAWYAIANETDPGISISDSSRLKYRQRADDAADFANEIRQEAAQ